MTTALSLRWFQFGIGTWLLLMAIAGWAFTCRPFWTDRHETFWRITQPNGTVEVFCMISRAEAKRRGKPTERMQRCELPSGAKRVIRVNATMEEMAADIRTFNPALRWPALALATVTLWKAGTVFLARNT